MATSDSKKLWQSTVLYHYYGLPQFFLESDVTKWPSSNMLQYARHHNLLLNTNSTQKQNFTKKCPQINDFGLQKVNL